MRKSQLQIWKEEKPGVADEVALGVTYNEIDDYLEGKQVSQKLKQLLKNGGTKANTNATCQSQYLIIFGVRQKSVTRRVRFVVSPRKAV